ncbi:MAG TPA: twin-arginine translocase subunit TatC [Gemmatimonadales bacterium]|nr:twin-arginine translocase subunit TatC [Gemmatimonadales bacterium]
MPFLDHLEELRWRILYSLLAIVVATLIGWLLVGRIDVIGALKRPIAPLLPDGRLVFTSPVDPFLITLKLAFVVGLLLSSPIVIYQVWAFLAPALYPRERRLIMPALAVGVLLFLGGAAAAYFWVLPRALPVFFSFQRNDLAPMITANEYFGFLTPFIIGFGVAAELPLVVVILATLGIVTPQFLARNRRYAIVLAAFAAALLTPPDAVSMVLMFGPLLLLYEISILCARVVTKRRARRERAASAAALALLLLAAGAGRLEGQGVPRPPRPPRSGPPVQPSDSVPGDSAGRGRTLDTATARRLGLPTGPTRSFPAGDAVMDSLRDLKGYRVTQYVADTLLVVGGDSQTIYLRREAFVEREGTQLEADSIRYRQRSCRLDAAGDPRLFDQGTVLVGEGMRYDTCIKRGTVTDALTRFTQGGATWYMRGVLAVDSGSTRLFGAHSEITSDDHPVPDYHFGTGEVKWLNKNVMVARPAVLYVRDVPIFWLPFIFQDIRPGRRSGILVPRFGLNDLVRPTRSYERHVSNIGYYFVLGDYVDLLVSGDWYADRYLTARGQVRYRWLDRFVSGSFGYSRTSQLDTPGSTSRINWQHDQRFSNRTRFNASIDYATRPSIVEQNSINPQTAIATIDSRLAFTKQFDWATLSLGGSRTQDLSNSSVSQTLPSVSLTPSPVNITPSITWSPGFSLDNQQRFRQAAGALLVAGTGGSADTLPMFVDARTTTLRFETPLRIGRWSWGNNFAVNDQTSNQREELLIPDSTAPGGVRRALYGRTFRTDVDWQTGISLPSLFSGTWKLQPGVQIANATGAGPFMIRNQFTGGRFLRQGKRLAFSASLSPTFFGFFPGVGPLQRIRHSVSPLVSYFYAPRASVPKAFATALDPTGKNPNVRTDPQQTITLGLSQNFEAKLKPPPGDTAGREPRKIRLLSINTSSIGYNFEQAKDSGRTGWTTGVLNNTFASDLLPGFTLAITHDLWRGAVGSDTAKFSPFLTSLTTSFALTPATIRGLASLFGLGGRGAPPAAPPAPGGAGAQGAPQGAGPRLGGGQQGFGLGAPAGRGFNLSVRYSSNRSRPVADSQPPPSALGGRRTLTLGLQFDPTAHWSASWNTAFDLDTRQFAAHAISLQRDLHRWHASFSFSRSPNGNFGFTFYISLLDQPDIKFDYEQQTLAR